MIYGYVRVSTDMQTTENQKMAILEFCKREGLVVDDWIAETVSGAKKYDKRLLGELLAHVQEGDTIISTEISRLGRSLFMVMEILNICMEKNVKVWTIKDNYRLGDGIESKVLAFAFGLAAEIERNMISERTKQGLARVRAQGTVLGRPKGRKSDELKLDEHFLEVQEMLLQKVPYIEIGRRVGVHRGTLDKYIKDRGLINPPKRRELFELIDADIFQHILDKGVTFIDLANSFKISSNYIKKVAAEKGVTLPVKEEEPEQAVAEKVHPLEGQDEQIRAFIDEGKTHEEIGRYYGIKPSRVSYWIKTRNLAKSKRGSKLDPYQAYIIAQLMQGKSGAWIAKDLNVSYATLSRYIANKKLKSWLNPNKDLMKDIRVECR